MYKTCNICGQIHNFDKVCYKKRNKKVTSNSKFRSTYAWQQKRNEIRERDLNICQLCLRDKYETDYVYNYKDLEVHHIVPLEEDYSKRLDSYNLITLCNKHHSMAEDGIVPRSYLKRIVEEYYEPPRGKEKNEKENTTPTAHLNSHK